MLPHSAQLLLYRIAVRLYGWLIGLAGFFIPKHGFGPRAGKICSDAWKRGGSRFDPIARRSGCIVPRSESLNKGGH